MKTNAKTRRITKMLCYSHFVVDGVWNLPENRPYVKLGYFTFDDENPNIASASEGLCPGPR